MPKVAVVAEYYPRRADPVLGIWAHRQARAAAPRVPRSTCSSCTGWSRRSAALAARDLRRPRRPAAPAAARDPRRRPGHLCPVRSPRLGALATPPGARGRRRRSRVALRGCAAASHSTSCTPTTPCPAATPSGARVQHAARRLGPRRRHALASRSARARARARSTRALAPRDLVLANSAGTASRCARRSGARTTRVVHLGTDLPAQRAPPASGPRS